VYGWLRWLATKLVKENEPEEIRRIFRVRTNKQLIIGHGVLRRYLFSIVKSLIVG